MSLPSAKKLLMQSGGLRPQDVFATSLYTGNGATQTITNGLNLAGRGGLVWAKDRAGANNNQLFDTVRGRARSISSNTAAVETTSPTGNDLTNFSSTGFSLGPPNQVAVNANGNPIASWSFRRAKKFFDIVTYTGDGQSGRQIPHGLGGDVGIVVVKRRDGVGGWMVWHRSTGDNVYLQLQSTGAAVSNPNYVQSANSATFTVGGQQEVNATGFTYVAYLFAQNPDLIDCGSYVGNGNQGSGKAVTCGSGWKPQFAMIKGASVAGGNWNIVDSARGGNAGLAANLADAEGSASLSFNATGFQAYGDSASRGPNINGVTYIYLAIRSPT